MKIAIIGAGGKAGRLIGQEARTRGHEVTGFGRSAKDGVDITKDVFDLTAADLAGFDVVVDALAFSTPETFPLHTTSLMHLADALSGTDVRLVVVGGAGSLYVDEQQSTQLKDTPDFPEMFKPMATAQADELVELRKRSDVKWTFVSPAAMFLADAPRLGSYELAGEFFTTGKDGKSEVSYADYAIAIVDEAEKAAHVGERISVRNA